MVTGYEQGFYRSVDDIARQMRNAATELANITGFVDETRQFISDSIQEDDGLMQVLMGIRDALQNPPVQVHVTIEARCWCGGKVGFREPGDSAGLGCLENIAHDWRAREVF